MTEPSAQMARAKGTEDALMHALQARQTMAGLIFAAMSMPRALNAPERSLPLTLIGGFLGAGKTTLLNHILSNPEGRKLVVLVNDFGKINIDAALIEEQTEDTINLTNGCACCAVSADLSKSLIEIAQRADRPDAIVLETSGVADPGSIAQIALTNRSIRLDGIITVVDAETLPLRSSDPATRGLFADQVTSADLIVLTKTDLLEAPAQESARSWFSDNHSTIPVIQAKHGQVAPEVVLGAAANAQDQADRLNRRSHRAAEEGHGFESLSFEVPEPLDREKLNAFLRGLPDRLLRAKGFCHLVQSPDHRTVFQRVGTRWSLKPGAVWGANRPVSSLVFIGPKGSLNREALAEGLKGCVAQPALS